jgi:sterol desaturase/sphingolipid hydroxylase (fatty acid hydroxylase superfamily)
VVFTYLIAHLHHTHVWIPFTGFWGKVLISPAHHQIHHSTNPVHFNKNMGSVLAIWDWLFGTLHIPAKNRERLTFGLGDGEVTEHTVTQELFRPVHALAELSGATASPARRSATDDAPARP